MYLFDKIDTSGYEDNYCVIFCDFRSRGYGPAGMITGQPRIIKILKSLTLKELYRHLFSYLLKLRKEVFKDTEKYFRQNFNTFFGNSYAENYFYLKIYNPFENPCCVCNKTLCKGCQLEYNETKLSKYIQSCKEPNMRISICLGSGTDTTFISKVISHESYNNVNESKIQDSVNIEECFNLFSRREQLDKNNTTYCSNCKEHLQGIKKMDIYKLPIILIIHFKRFKQKAHSSSKNTRTINFPLEDLDMGRFSLGCEGIYDLYAVSSHYGMLEGGHYTAYAKSVKGQWREFNDSSVSLINDVREKITPSAYVLFYKKREFQE